MADKERLEQGQKDEEEPIRPDELDDNWLRKLDRERGEEKRRRQGAGAGDVASRAQQEEAAEAPKTATELVVPAFTLRASEPCELRAFIHLVHNAEVFGFSPARVQEMHATMRDFELYEAGHRV